MLQTRRSASNQVLWCGYLLIISLGSGCSNEDADPKPLLKIDIPIHHVVLDAAGDIIQLTIVGDECKDEHLQALTGLTKLKKLHLRSRSITDEGLQALAGLRSLEELTILAAEVGPGLEHLRSLKLKRYRGGLASLSHLRHQKQLEVLDIFALPDDNPGQFRPFTRLTELSVLLGSRLPNQNDYKALAGLKVLRIEGQEYPGYSGQLSVKDLTALSHAKSLERLYLRHASIDDERLKVIAQLTNLRTLDISDSEVTNEGLAAIETMRQLEELHLNSASYDLTDDGLGYLSKMTQLKVLGLSDNRITNRGLGSLSSLKNLRELNLSDTAVGDQGMKIVSGFTELRVLRVGKETRTLGGGLGLLHNNSHLLGGQFELRNGKGVFRRDDTALTDVGVSYLTPLQKLEVLDVKGRLVTVKVLDKDDSSFNRRIANAIMRSGETTRTMFVTVAPR